MDEIELLPCAQCGKEGHLSIQDIQLPNDAYKTVFCSSCLACGPRSHYNPNDAESKRAAKIFAADLWNAKQMLVGYEQWLKELDKRLDEQLEQLR